MSWPQSLPGPVAQARLTIYRAAATMQRNTKRAVPFLASHALTNLSAHRGFFMRRLESLLKSLPLFLGVKIERFFFGGYHSSRLCTV